MELHAPALAAPAISLLGAAILAAWPHGRATIATVVATATAIATLALAILAGVHPSGVAGVLTGARTDDAARLFALLLAFLGLAANLAGIGDGAQLGLRGPRLRLARAAPALLTGTGLCAIEFADPALALGALGACGLAAASSAAITRGAATAHDAARLLLVVATGLAAALLGIALTGASPMAAGLVLLGAGAFGPLAPSALAWSTAAGRAAPALAGPILLAPMLAGFAIMLGARAELAAAGWGQACDALLVVSGLGSLILASLRPGAAGRTHAATEAATTATVGLAGVGVFAAGLGGSPGTQAALVSIAFATVTGMARILAAALADGPVRRMTLLATIFCPPFGMFAAIALVLDVAMPTRPLAGLCLLVCLGGFIAANAARTIVASAATATIPVAPSGLVGPSGSVSPKGQAARRAVIATCLALSAILGIAMPNPMAGAIVDAAERLAPGGL